MNISYKKENTIMNYYIRFLYKFKLFLAIVIPIIILLFSLRLTSFSVDGSYRVWFSNDLKELTIYDDFTSTFGNDNNIIIVFKDSNGIFNKKALYSIENLTDKILDIEDIESVNSLLNYQYIHKNKNNDDEIVLDNFIEKIDTLSEDFLQKRKKVAINSKDIVNRFISKDATTTLLIVTLEDQENSDFQILKKIKKIINEQEKLTDYKYWINGSLVVEESFISTAKSDLLQSIPIALILVISVLFIIFRKISSILLPLSIVFLSILSVMAIYITIGYKFNTFTINIPLFIIAIGTADAIHVYTLWSKSRKKRLSNYHAVYISLSRNIFPIFLTTLTSIIGFLSLSLSDIPPVHTLGIATGIGSIFAFAITILWMPAVLLLLKKERLKTYGKLTFKIKFNYGSFIVKNKKSIIILFLFLVSILGSGIFKLHIDSNMIKLFSKNVEVRKSTEFIMENLTGTQSYEIIIDSGDNNNIQNPDFMKKINKFYQEYYSEFNEVKHITSLIDTIKQYNEVANSTYSIPNDRALIAQYILLYSMSLPQDMNIENKVDFEQRFLRVTALTNIMNTNRSIEMVKFIEEWWKNTPYHVNVTGKAVLSNSLQSKITDTLVSSMSFTVLIVSIIMFFVFRKIETLWIVMLPNILPVILMLGIMGWLEINLDMGIAISGAIIISIAIDDSIHYLMEFFSIKEKEKDMEIVLNKVLYNTGEALALTTLLLVLTFLASVFSDFLPNKNFAIITSSGLFVALLIDLFFLPALLISVKNKTGEKK